MTFCMSTKIMSDDDRPWNAGESDAKLLIYDEINSIKKDFTCSCNYPHCSDVNDNGIDRAALDQLSSRLSALERRNVLLKSSNETLTDQNSALEDQINELIEAKKGFEKQINELKQYYQRKIDGKLNNYSQTSLSL